MFELKDATMIYDMDKEEKVYAMKSMNITFPDKGLVGIIGPDVYDVHSEETYIR